MEAVNICSSTPEYITEDWQAIQSSVNPAKSPLKSDDTETNASNDKKR